MLHICLIQRNGPSILLRVGAAFAPPMRTTKLMFRQLWGPPLDGSVLQALNDRKVPTLFNASSSHRSNEPSFLPLEECPHVFHAAVSGKVTCFWQLVDISTVIWYSWVSSVLVQILIEHILCHKCLHYRGAWVWSLVGELWSHKLHGAVGEKKEESHCLIGDIDSWNKISMTIS